MSKRVASVGRKSHQRHGGREDESPSAVIAKILHHSKNGVSLKLLKYFGHAKRLFGSTNLKLWMELRKKGGLDAIQGVIRTLVEDKSTQTTEVSREGESCNCSVRFSTEQKDVGVAGLSILGNAFSLDYAARKDVALNGFIEVLHKLIQMYLNLGGSLSTEQPLEVQNSKLLKKCDSCVKLEELVSRSVKCVANLAHDGSCRDLILKSGVGISILKIMEAYNQEFLKLKVAQGVSGEIKVDLVNWFTEGHKECVRNCIRAVRILSSEPFCSEEARIHLIRFGSVITIGKILTWNIGDLELQDINLDIVRALISLTDRIRLLPGDQINELVNEEMNNETLKMLVELFRGIGPDQKLFSPLVRCLSNLGCNVHIAEALGRLHMFSFALDKLKQSPTKASAEICRLMVTLTKQSSVNQCLLYNCQEIWSTVNVLRSPSLPDFHRWVLHVYENVYERSLKSLIQNGLIELIHEHLKEELGECDFEMLKRKIMSMEDESCKVHQDGCSFIPVYRCDSPLYQQVQEEVKILLKGRESQSKTDLESGSSGIESSSPSSSPARSWTSDDSSITDLNSPRRARSPSSSEDEGCYSPVYSFSSSSPTYSSQDSPVDAVECEMSEDDEVCHQAAKRIKLDDKISSDSSFVTNDSISRLVPASKKFSSENLKATSKKIVSMLNILLKCTHLTPMPMNLLQVGPLLLSVIVRGIVSLTPQRDNYCEPQGDLECVALGRQSFSLAYRILNTMCLNIHMFPDFLKNGTITIVSRLLMWDKLLDKLGNTQSVRGLLDTLGGDKNKTAGWREGFVLRTLMISKCEEEISRIAISVPLLFRKNDLVLRNFESQGRSWSRVFEMLVKTDDIGFSRFQDCILSISKLCETIGMRWTDAEDASKRPLLWKPEGNYTKMIESSSETPMDEDQAASSNANEDNQHVEVELDDGSQIRILKSLLTQASPVFSAMFDGHFVEAGEQKVRIPNTSKEAITALTDQIFSESELSKTPVNDILSNPTLIMIDRDCYSLSTLFELISLSDRFLLQRIYERTLNTLLRFYICPYSAPLIYEEAVKLSGLLKPHPLHGWHLDLTYVILKYLLVGDMSMNCKCAAFKKIFDSVSPSVVVGDIRALVEYYSTRPQR